MTIKERLYAFIESQGLSVLGFERTCGLSNGYVSSVGENISLRSLELILAAFPSLNRAWLLKEEGDMLLPSEIQPNSTESSGVADIVIPGAAWVVIQQQSASLERKDRQLDRCISMLETSFALLKGAAVPAAASVAAAGESAG
jgi:hypothetical protein